MSTHVGEVTLNDLIVEGQVLAMLNTNAGITSNTIPITANSGITSNNVPITANAGINFGSSSNKISNVSLDSVYDSSSKHIVFM